jgi:hypothetical protein
LFIIRRSCNLFKSIELGEIVKPDWYAFIIELLLLFGEVIILLGDVVLIDEVEEVLVEVGLVEINEFSNNGFSE